MQRLSDALDSNGHAPAIRHGVVAVALRAERLLVIRRSRYVDAPGKLCFPGGGIERGEDETGALRRELREELNLEIQPRQRLWRSVTPWRVGLSWWHVALPAAQTPAANPAEVEEILWLTPTELLSHPDVLSSNRGFLQRLVAREFLL